jgi:hypothetical protein
MKIVKKTVKPTSIFLAIVLLLVFTLSQSASAAMIGTEKVLQAAESPAKNRDYLNRLMTREKVKSALIARGIDPLEAQQRIQSLTDYEVQYIVDRISDLAAGSGVEIFSLIVIAAIIATVLIFKFTRITEVFP